MMPWREVEREQARESNEEAKKKKYNSWRVYENYEYMRMADQSKQKRKKIHQSIRVEEEKKKKYRTYIAVCVYVCACGGNIVVYSVNMNRRYKNIKHHRMKLKIPFGAASL